MLTRRAVLPLPLLALAPFARAAEAATMRIATVAPAGTPWSEGLDQFKKQVEAATAGSVVVRPMLSGVLGDENETVVATQRGQIEAVGASTGALASVVPELNVLELPYLFRSAEEADHILDTVILADLDAAFRKRGLVLGFWSENGFRCFGTSFGPVTSPASLAGHKMRSQESPVHLEMWRAFGASPVPIPVTEVLTSLQTGVIDGYDNTALFALAAQWNTATKHFTVSNHIYQPAAIVFNAAWFDARTPEQQKALMGGRGTLVDGMRELIRAMTPELLDNLRYMDVTVHEHTATERASFEAPAKAARDAYMAKASAGEKALLDKITKGLVAWRAAHP